ncbi:MAG: hypothetical protein WA053_00720 [Minisyncoccia bacterium]
MKKSIGMFGTTALALIMSGLPAIALAENRGEGSIETDVRVQAVGVQGSTSVTVRGEDESENRGRVEEGELSATSSVRVSDDDSSSGRRGEGRGEMRGLLFALEGTTTQAYTLEQLKRLIEARKDELDDEEASTTPKDRDLIKNANPVRLAVHSLLASKDILGGIGPRVSEIAKHMNDSVATTTGAEARIRGRGFLSRVLFGGDRAAAEVISKEIAQNETRIADLTKLLGEANVSVEIQATLQAQITAVKEVQARLQALAEKEQGMWGLFSWRF